MQTVLRLVSVLWISAARLRPIRQGDQIITDNRCCSIGRKHAHYLDIRTVVVSCGTCYDQLQGYEFDRIFPGCRIVDIHEFLMEKVSGWRA